ncbi:MAG: quinone oxidoreductase [Acidobacteria bacterium]|nr:quinone oxidoreductase [Acidobacteriota bacterium]
MKAVCVHETGGPDKLVYEEAPLPSPGPGQVLIRIRSIGVNFIDIYHRKGMYPASTPFIPGMEASGIAEELGEGITEIKPGDRVAYAMTLGSYAEYAVVEAERLIPIPESMEFESASAALLQGMTAHYLTHSTFPLQKGATLLLHAAAGGVGLLLTQIARRMGAYVIATVSTDEKAALAREAGAGDVVLYSRSDFEAEVKRITAGTGVDVVFDSVGRDTFDKSLNCLKPRGTMVLFGQSSGPVPPLDPNILNPGGSLYLTRPNLSHYVADRAELLQRAGDIFRWIDEGSLKMHIDGVFSLRDASEVHQLLESRNTRGKVLLRP